MGLRLPNLSFRLSERHLFQLDDIERALSPFMENPSAAIRLCIDVAHMTLFRPPTYRERLRVLRALVRVNKQNTRTEEQARALKRKFELAARPPK